MRRSPSRRLQRGGIGAFGCITVAPGVPLAAGKSTHTSLIVWDNMNMTMCVTPERYGRYCREDS